MSPQDQLQGWAARADRRCSRRALLRGATGAALGAAWAERLWAQAPAAELPPLNRYSRMVHEFFDAQIRAAQEVGLKRKAALQTRADAEAYVQFVRQQIRTAFGPFPERTPLKPRVSGIVDRDAYTIEKIAFESRPEFYVTANLYIPKNRQFPLPAVVGSCGHSANGKAGETYQSFAQGLARQGYVVLIYDPIGQGERFQYANAQFKSDVGPGTAEHLLCGNQQFLVGEFFGTWRAWDGVRALDYLLARPEVDPQHVGITGNSGGGTLTMWLCGLDQRWSMAAPGCAVTTFRRNFQNELPADTEQCPPKILALGLEHDDLLAALAPKPIIILAQEQDFFDVRGAQESYERLRKLYRLLGAERNIQLHIGPDPHGYSRPNREAMYTFFNRQTGVDSDGREPQLTIERDETLHVMPHGQVVDVPSKTVMDFTREQARAFQERRPQLDAAQLQAALRDVLQLPEISGAPEYRILRVISGRKFPLPSFTTYAVQTDPGIEAIVYRLGQAAHYARPARGAERCTLYVSHHSSDAELRSEAWLRDLALAPENGPFYTCDVRGVGESRPDTCGANTFLGAYGSDYFYAAHAIMLDRPYVGMRTFDVLRVLAWLQDQGHREVHLVAKGWGTLPGTFAAVLSDAVVKVTLRNALTSYQLVAEARRYAWPLSTFAPGVLARFDLPDCHRVLEQKGLTLEEPWDANGQVTPMPS